MEKSTRRDFFRRSFIKKKKFRRRPSRNRDAKSRGTYVSRSTTSPPEATTVSWPFPSEAATIAKYIPFGVLRMRSENRVTFRFYLIIERNGNLPISRVSSPCVDWSLILAGLVRFFLLNWMHASTFILFFFFTEIGITEVIGYS